MAIKMPREDEVSIYEGTRGSLYVPFDLEEAAEAWGANCGPGALAALTAHPLAEIRPHLVNWPGYTNPTHMKRALGSLGWAYDDGLGVDRFQGDGLAFVQWVGPWDKPGNQRWAYRYTHWIAFSQAGSGEIAVFDVNNGEEGGWCWLDDWAREIVPLLLPKRATGYRFRTYIQAWPEDAIAAGAGDA